MPVAPCEMPLDSALSKGAMALFGEKYGDTVRVVTIGKGDSELSIELCGGTHVGRTGEIGAFSIVAESGIAAGVRRIEAVTGKGAVRKSREEAVLIREAAAILKAAPADLIARASALASEVGSLRKALEDERHKSAGGSVDAMMSDVREERGIRLLSGRTEAADIATLRSQADRLRDLLGSGAGALGAVVDGSNVIIAVVTQDLASQGRLKAGDVVRRMAEVIGGKGGGRPHLAQAGGGDSSKLDEALEAFYTIARELTENGDGA
jgi:alanyl-tRNA synthetase